MPMNSKKGETASCGLMWSMSTSDSQMASRSRSKPEVVVTSDRNKISKFLNIRHVFGVADSNGRMLCHFRCTGWPNRNHTFLSSSNDAGSMAQCVVAKSPITIS